jgi:hypothetical protein
VAPEIRGGGIGSRAFQLLLDEAFKGLRLLTVCGECYRVPGSAEAFWTRETELRQGYIATLPRRKFWNGQLYDALYFSIARPE